MINNKRKIFYIDSFIFLLYFLKEVSVFLNKNLFSCYLLDFTFENDILFKF